MWSGIARVRSLYPLHFARAPMRRRCTKCNVDKPWKPPKYSSFDIPRNDSDVIDELKSGHKVANMTDAILALLTRPGLEDMWTSYNCHKTDSKLV